MSYSGAIFYVDDGLVSGDPGDDAARSTLSAVVFSNPSGDVVRGTSALHGLVTGAVIDVTGTTNGNGAYKITVNDVNTFDLDGASWAAFNGADNIGDAVPRGGSSWADAWATVKSGATAARIQAGDTVRVAKSPDPVSLGITATWNDLSKTVTLASALTLEVDDCDSGWSAANSATVTHNTTRKEGSNCVNVTKSSYLSGTKYAYKALAGSTDFSNYDSATFWVWCDAAFLAGRWKLCLCSDTLGATIVDTFPIPAMPAANVWAPVKVVKSGGGALGSAIQSVAIWSDTSAPPSSQDLRIDNINACDNDGLSLVSLLSKSSAAVSDGEGWYPIQSIVGTTILLDNTTATGAASGLGYSGTTETVTTYRRETIKTTMAAVSTDSAVAFNDSGSETSRLIFEGGWNPGGTQNGETFYDGQNGLGYGLYVNAVNYLDVERFSACRYGSGIRFVNSPRHHLVSLGTIAACTTGLDGSSPANDLAVTIAAVVNCGNGVDPGYCNSHVTVTGKCSNNTGNAFDVEDGIIDANEVENNDIGARFSQRGGLIRGASMRANASGDLSLNTATQRGQGIARNCTLGSSTEIYSSSFIEGWDLRIISHNHDGGDDHQEWTDGGECYTADTAFAAPAADKMWRLEVTSSYRNAFYPLTKRIFPVACRANEEVTVEAVMRKSHATNVEGGIRILGGQIAGVASDLTATLADNTNEQTLELTFEPTEAGVVWVEAWSAYVADFALVDIDRVDAAVTG